MEKYLYKDVVSAFNYAQQNPTNTIDEWLEVRSKTLTKEEEELYEGVSYATFEIPYEDGINKFFVFKAHSYDILENAVHKFIGTRGYYELIPESYLGEFFKIISLPSDFFMVNKWNDLENFKGVKIMESEDKKIKIMYDGLINNDDTDEDNDFDFDFYGYYKDGLKRNSYFFWDSNSYMEIFIEKSIDSSYFEYKNISELFETN